jgi:hypothetical protein
MNRPALLDQSYALTEGQIDEYRRTGAVHLSRVLDSETLSSVRSTIRRLTREGDRATKPLDERDTYGRAFTQVFNLWRRDELARALAFSTRLAGIAAGLMGCNGVRMYHDQALFKEAGGGHTPWHCDQFYWPVATDNTITAWIPMQATPLEMGPLAFAKGSHNLEAGRGLSISDESEQMLSDMLADYPHEEIPFELGDVSFHAGWVYHHARGNSTGKPREVFTIIYLDKDARLRSPASPFEAFDARTWCPGVEPGELVDSEINPVLYEHPPS